MRVDQIMASDIQAAAPRETVAELRHRMREHSIHALPVVDARGRPVGIVTSSDLLADCSPENPVAAVMVPRVLTVPPDTDVRVAAGIMRVQRVHHLVVVGPEGSVVGLISTFDLLRLVEEH